MSVFHPYIVAMFNEIHIAPETANMVFFWKPQPKRYGQVDEACCCQWWLEDFAFEGVTFRSAEHAMMYGKAKMFGDADIMRQVLLEPKPSEVKKLGRKVKNFSDPIWNEKSYALVLEINKAKFTQSPRLKKWLMTQPDNTVFVEASPFDELWGIKRANDGKLNLHDIQTWKGYNKLGFAITQVFQELKIMHSSNLGSSIFPTQVF